MNIPDYYLPVMPYLILDNSSDFLAYAKRVFNAEEKMIVPGENNTIMHGEIMIGKAVIMFAQATDTWKQQTAGMFLYVDNVDMFIIQGLSRVATHLTNQPKKNMVTPADLQTHSVTSGGLRSATRVALFKIRKIQNLKF